MAKKETIVKDKVYEDILESFKESRIRYGDGYKYWEETPDDFIESRICYYRRCHRRACEESGRYANWRDIDKYRIYIEYLDGILKERIDKLFSNFKFVKI